MPADLIFAQEILTLMAPARQALLEGAAAGILSTSRSLAGTKWLGHAGEMTPEPATYPGYRFPAEIISYAVWLYHVFGLSFRRWN